MRETGILFLNPFHLSLGADLRFELGNVSYFLRPMSNHLHVLDDGEIEAIDGYSPVIEGVGIYLFGGYAKTPVFDGSILMPSGLCSDGERDSRII